jgi:hypothetical protein
MAFRIQITPLHCILAMTPAVQPNIPTLLLLCLLPSLALSSSQALALAQQVGRERDIVELRLGQRVLVDDGTCPAGQINEVSGAKMTSAGVARERKCIPRFGPKQK